jgi:hypothetical protein
MLSFFVFGLAPLPTALLALRWRKIGAGIFAAIAVVIAVGFVDDDMYMAARNGTSLKPQQEMASLILPVVPLLLLAAFYLITGVLRWPKISGTTRLPS